MLHFTRLRLRPSWLLVTAGLIAGGTAANSTEAPPLAQYITAICTAAFHSAPPREAPFLAENVGAMTRMMVAMEIKPSGDIDTRLRAR